MGREVAHEIGQQVGREIVHNLRHEIREAARREVREAMGKLTPAKREHVHSTAEYARGVKKKRRDGG